MYYYSLFLIIFFKNLIKINLPDGIYDLGLAPTYNGKAKLLFRIQITYGNIIDLDRGIFNWIPIIKFIMKSGQCSINEIKHGYKYLLLNSKF